MNIKIHQKYFEKIKDEEINLLLSSSNLYLINYDIFYQIKGLQKNEARYKVLFPGSEDNHIIFIENEEVRIEKYHDGLSIPYHSKSFAEFDYNKLILAARPFAGTKLNPLLHYDIIFCRNIKNLIKLGGTNVVAGPYSFYLDFPKIRSYNMTAIQIPEFEKDEMYILPLSSYIGYIVRNAGTGSLVYAVAEKLIKVPNDI